MKEAFNREPIVSGGSDLAFTPSGDISATNIQAAIEELDTEKMKRIVSVDNEIARFDGIGGDVQGYSSNAPTISDGGIISFGNDVWTRAANFAGTDVINMLKVNVDDEIETGATLITGSIEAVEDAGEITLYDMPVSINANAGDKMSATLKTGGGNILTIGAEADGAGGIQNKFLSSPVTETKCIKIDTNLYGNPSTNPPASETLGSVQVATFTVGTDKGRYKCPIPDDYAGGAMALRLYWTKSTAADESTKTVKWQVKEKPLYIGNNIAAGETTVSIQDVYDSAVAGEYLLYETDAMTIPATAVGRAHSFEVEAIAPTGTALSEPALVYGCLEYTAYVL